MGAGYKLAALEAARPGMVLSDVLLDAQGNMLLPKGAVLTEAMLAALARHGIAMLPVATDEQACVDAREVQARLDHLFRKNERDDNDDWATATLRGYVELYRGVGHE